jgi:hypothetical protein
MRRMSLILAATAIALTACAESGGRAPAGAAQSASRLMAAAIARDRVAFEAQIDRRALREDLRRQMVELAQQNGVEVAGGPSDFALDRMIGPDAVRLVRAGTHEALQAAPSPAQVAKLLVMVSRKKACLRAPEAGERCLLTFAKVDDGWRLVGMQAMDRTIPVAGG